jgi:NAD(P)-dependent dehydrogenase (short-subunit alcohol dehydrogenase family)
MAGLLENKVAIVTGGSMGIGRATAEAMAREGARVVVAARGEKAGKETVAAIRKAGGEATFVRCDVSKPDQVEALIERAVKTYGRLDCACNNAGFEGERKLIHEVAETDWDAVMDINLTGAWLCVKYEILAMLKTGDPSTGLRARGSIVNVSSANCLIGTPTFTPYTASKHGVLGLTKAAALEYAKEGIRVNAVCPGGVATPMFDRLYGVETPKRQQVRQGHPLGREARPDEVARAIVWLCSDKASYINGATLSIDSGLTIQ